MASMVSGVCTSPATPLTGCFLPTYSGRGMDGGTVRGGEIRPGTSGVVMEYECSQRLTGEDRKSTRLNSSHVKISYAVFCLKKKVAPAAMLLCPINSEAHKREFL